MTQPIDFEHIFSRIDFLKSNLDHKGVNKKQRAELKGYLDVIPQNLVSDQEMIKYLLLKSRFHIWQDQDFSKARLIFQKTKILLDYRLVNQGEDLGVIKGYIDSFYSAIAVFNKLPPSDEILECNFLREFFIVPPLEINSVSNCLDKFISYMETRQESRWGFSKICSDFIKLIIDTPKKYRLDVVLSAQHFLQYPTIEPIQLLTCVKKIYLRHRVSVDEEVFRKISVFLDDLFSLETISGGMEPVLLDYLNAISRLLVLHGKDRSESILHSITPFCSFLDRFLYMPKLFRSLLKINPSDFDEIVSQVDLFVRSCAIEEINYEVIVSELIECFLRIPREFIDSTLKTFNSLLTPKVTSQDKFVLLRLLSKMSEKDKNHLILVATPLIEDILVTHHRYFILETFRSILPEDWSWISTCLRPFKAVFTNPFVYCMFIRIIPHFPKYSIPSILHVMIGNIDNLVSLSDSLVMKYALSFTSLDFLEEMYHHLIQKISSISDRNYLIAFASEVREYSACFSLIGKEEELNYFCQQQIYIAENKTHPLYPYNVFEKLKCESIKPFETNAVFIRFKEPSCSSLTDRRFTLDLSKVFVGLNETINKEEIERVCRGFEINKDTLNMQASAFKARVDALDETSRYHALKYVADCTGLDIPLAVEPELARKRMKKHFVNLIKNLKDPFFQALLIEPLEDDVPLKKGYLYAVLASLLSLKNTLEPVGVLTDREESMIKLSSSIQNCSTGKSEGLILSYSLLSPAFKYEQQDQEVLSELERKCKNFTLSILQREFFHMISMPGPFLFEVTGESATISQLAHQTLYIKNLLSNSLNLAHQLEFDAHTNVLYDKLVSYSLQEMINIVQMHFSITKMIKSLQDSFNVLAEHQKAPIFNGINEMLASDPLSDVWDVDDEGSYSLSSLGAFYLLERFSIVTEVKEPAHKAKSLKRCREE